MPDLRGTARRRAVPLFLFFAFCAVWTLTALTPLIADDYIYAFSYADGSRLNSLDGILLSLRHHSIFVNARVLSHFLVMSFLTLPKWVFNLCNALVLTAGLATQAGFLRVWGRERLLPCAAAVREIRVEGPVKAGEVLRKDFLGTGTDLVASMTL